MSLWRDGTSGPPDPRMVAVDPARDGGCLGQESPPLLIPVLVTGIQQRRVHGAGDSLFAFEADGGRSFARFHHDEKVERLTRVFSPCRRTAAGSL